MESVPPFAILILTVSREPQYLYQTLASLYASDPTVRDIPVYLVVGSPDESFLRPVTEQYRLQVLSMSEQAWSRIAAWSVHRRLAYNYWRALTVLGSDADGLRGLLVCEDDIVFRDGFVMKLSQAIEEMSRRERGKQILTVYSAYDYARDPGRKRGRFYCSYDATAHYGNCCIYYSRDVVAEAAEIVLANAAESADAPADIVIGWLGELIWRNGTGGMYQTVVSLVQHTGVVSGGTSSHYHASPTFDRPWPC